MKTTSNESLDAVLLPIAKACLVAPAWVAGMTLAWAWYGYVLHLLWAWFIVPAFGLPAVSIPVAIGLSLVVGFMTKSYTHDPEGEAWWKKWARMYMRPAVALLVGWIVTKFI